MSAKFIQSIFFMCICSSVHAMNKKQKDIVHAKLHEKYEITETPTISRPVIQPLADLKLKRSTIRTNHFRKLLDTNQHEQAIDSYKKTKKIIPDDISILAPQARKKYTANHNTIKKSALEGNAHAQTCMTQEHMNNLTLLPNVDDVPQTTKFYQCFHAYGLFDIATLFKKNNIPFMPSTYDLEWINFRNNMSTINPSVAYIIQSIYYLKSVTENEKKLRYSKLLNMTPESAETELICQFLINYGNDTLSPQDVAKKFIEAINNCEHNTKNIIQTIEHCANGTILPQDLTAELIETVKTQKNSADMLTAIAKSPLFSHVIQKLNHATLENKDKQLISDMHYTLAELHYNNDDYVKANAHYKQNTVAFLEEKKAQCKAFKACITATHSFDKQDINYLSALVNSIEKSPLISEAIQKLSNVTLDNNDPLTPNLHYTLAELHYKNEDYIQAHAFYKKNTATFLKNKKTQRNAFNACVTASQSFDKQDINYLSSLVANVYTQLHTIDTANPALSYRVGLLIQALVNNNPAMNSSEKINMLNDALHHLECTQEGITTRLELHAELATLYTQQNDHVSALKHTTNALQLHNSDSQQYAIAHIVEAAKENSFDFYKQHAQSIQYIVDFIITKNYAANPKKNYRLPSEFISSDTWKQLLPYCDQAYEKHKNANNDITYAMALSNVDSGNADKACTYIDALPQPLSHAAQLLKARIYLATQKTMSDEELETTFKAFVLNKKTSSTDQETIASLLTQSDQSDQLLAQPKNHDLAIKLITKLSDKSTPHAAILLAFHITDHLQMINSPNIKQWQEKLKSCDQFYTNIAAPSEYNSFTNFAAGLLLMNNGITRTYMQVISYFMTALQSKELLPASAQSAHKAISALYNSWAMAVTDDHNARLVLFNKALQYNNNSTTRFNYAIAIFEHSEDQDLINKALHLLEENSTQDCPMRTPSQLALTQAHCHYSTDATRMLIFKKLIPLDINKAIKILQNHNNQPGLLKPLISILAGESIWIPIRLAEQYANLEQALHYMNVLLDTDKNNIDYISLRMELYVKLKRTDDAITDIDRMLDAQDLSNSRGITKETLLCSKANYLLQKTPNDALYDQILECFKQLTTCNEKNIKDFNTYPLVQEHTKYLVDNNIMTDSAIEWCCFAASSCVAANAYTIDSATLLAENLLSKEPTQEEKDFAHYILSAAKTGNLDAQLIVLPYLNTIGYVSESNLTEALRYSHQALCLSKNTHKRANVTFLIEILQSYMVKQGVTLAYYILCDYYKNYPKEIEKRMLLFNQAKRHELSGDDATDLIETIFKSCKHAFSKNAQHCVKNKKNLHKLTLTDGIALFTLGSMYQYSNIEDVLKSAISYLEITYQTLCEKFKLKQYQTSIQFFLGSARYKLALINEKINYELLCKSAKTGYLAAVYKMAHIYIEQHASGRHDVPVVASDFMPLLEKDLNCQSSRELFKKCTDIAISKEKDNDRNDKPVLVKFKGNSTDLTEFLKASAQCVTKNQIAENGNHKINCTLTSPHVTTLVKNIQHQETNKHYLTALQCIHNNKCKEAIPSLLQATHEKHPSASMFIAFIYIEGSETAKDYTFAEKSLYQAFSHGLVDNGTTKQFDTLSFLNTSMDFIKCLITEEHPPETKSHLLSTIDNRLTRSGIDMNAFCTLFNEMHNIDLSKIPEWRPISSARKAIIKDINNTEIPSGIAKAMAASKRGDKVAALNHMHFAAITEKIPSACMLLSWDYLFGNGVEQNNDASEKYLRNAFAYGLVEHQFCTDNFLYTMYACIQQLVSLSTSSATKTYFLQIIKEELITHGINMAAFYTVVKDNTGVDLLNVPEWSTISDLYAEIEEKTDIDLTAISDQPRKKRIQDLTTIVKDYNNTECPPEIIDALFAFEKGNKAAALKAIRNAAKKHNIPSAHMLLTCNYFRGDGVKQNYALSQEHLQNALTYGFVGNQLCSSNFFGTVCTFMTELIQGGHLPSMKQHFFQIISQALIDHNMDTDSFYTLVGEYSELDFYQHIEQKNLFPFIKNHNYKETSSTFLAGLQAYQHKDRKKAFDYIYKAATAEHHATACLYASYHYHTGDMVKKNNKQSNILLLEGMANGLITGKYSSFQFLIELCTYIKEILSNKNDNTAYSLQIIKSALTVQGIDPAHFCKIYKEYTNADLASVQEWAGTETSTTHTNAPVQPQLSITDLKKNMVKDHTNSNLSDDFKKALTATIQKDMTKSTLFMDIAAENNDPCAHITLATNYLLGKEGKTKNLAIAGCHLKAALQHAFIDQRFCNSLFLTRLCQFIQHMVSMPCTSENKIKLKKHLCLEIKKQLHQKDINVANFCDIVANDTNTQLHTCPEWIDAESAAQFTQEELESYLDDSLNEFGFGAEVAQSKQQATIQPVNQKNNLVKDQDYEESPAFITAMEAIGKGTVDSIKRGLELTKHVAETEKHPQAYLLLVSEHLKGNCFNVNKKLSEKQIRNTNIQLSEKYLKSALEYGIVEKQFCNNGFLQALHSCIYVVLTDHPKNIKLKLLPIIKNSLEAKAVDMKLFEAMFEKEYTISLSTVFEWSGTDAKAINTNAPVQQQQPSINDLRKKMVKDHTNKLSDDFKKAFAATIQKNIPESIRLLTLAANEQDPCACIMIALNYFTGEGMKKSLYLSQACLKEALQYGLIEQQFCNNFFLNKLCSYIKTVISTEYAHDDIIFKKCFLHKIKKNLIAHKMNLTDFCTIVLNETQIDLLTCPEWIASEKDYKLNFEQKGSLATEALIPDANVKQVIMNHLQNMKTKQENQQKNKLVQHPSPPHSLAFAAVQDAGLKGDIKKCMALAKIVAENENHPRAYILLAFEHVRGTFLERNIDASKQFLINALVYGLVQQHFYDDEFLEDVCDYINFVIKAKYSKNNKQTLLSIIKKALEKHSVDLNAFYDVFKKQHKMNLSTIAEWNS